MAEAVTPSNTSGDNVSVLADTKTAADVTTAKDSLTDNAKIKDAPLQPKIDDTKPVEYTDFKLPEGFVSDDETLTEFKSTAKELKLTQEQAQKLIDMQTKLTAKQTKMTQDQWADVQKDWRTKSQADTEIGGANFQANVGVAKKALEKYGTPEFKQAIEVTGMGNHPELIRFLYRVGKGLTEDKMLTDGNSSAGSRDPAKILFPTMN